MKIQIHYTALNSSFDQEYANEYHFGKESESNTKSQWGASYLLKNVLSIELIEKTAFALRIENMRNSKVEFLNIPEVCTLRCHFTDNTSRDFSISHSLLQKTHQITKKDGKVYFYFYINDDKEFVHPCNNLMVERKLFEKLNEPFLNI